jgi:tRNA modification GTPase
MANEPNRNTAALLTPAGVGAIAVVRISGPLVKQFLESHFARPAKAGRCVHADLRDGGKVIDDPVIVLSSDGDRADINLHGGIWIVEACLNLARRDGFSIVDAANAPLPLFALDGASELENEVLACLPLATTELALRVLLAQPEAWARLNLTALDQKGADRLLANRSLHWLLHPPRVAIVGIPNAGKSTLANQLFGQQRSITADLPGTTRDWVGEIANLDGFAITLVDTPGIRISDDAIEMEAIDRAGKQLQSADAIVLVLDATRMGEPSQMELLKRFPDAIRVLNKSDGCAASAVAASIQTVATTGQGIDALRSAIRSHFQCEHIDLNAARCWTQRQYEMVQNRNFPKHRD